MLGDPAFLIPTYIRNLQNDVCELQSTKLATGIFLLSPATAINPTFQGLLIISFNLIIFFGMYLINPSSFSWRLSMLASLWQQWLVPMTLTSFWSITSYNTFFSFKLIYNPSSNTERWTVNIRYALRVPVLLVFENRKIRNYKVTDFFPIQKLAIQNLSSFFQDPSGLCCHNDIGWSTPRNPLAILISFRP